MNRALTLLTLLAAQSAMGQIASVSWRTIDCGGGTSTAGGFALSGTIGQHDAGVLSGGGMTITGGFWGVATASTTPAPCYPNCDGSTVVPNLNIADFTCFLNRFQNGETYANCDHSSVQPVLNVQDFVCFINAFQAGCQ